MTARFLENGPSNRNNFELDCETQTCIFVDIFTIISSKWLGSVNVCVCTCN